MQAPKSKQPKMAAFTAVRVSSLLKEQVLQHILLVTNPGVLGVGDKKKREKAGAENYKVLRQHHVPIELALAFYSCWDQSRLVVDLAARALSVDDKKVRDIISYLLGDDAAKKEEVLRCYDAWRKDPKSTEQMKIEFTTELRDKILERVDVLQEKIKEKAEKKSEKNVPMKDATKFMQLKPSKVSSHIRSAGPVSQKTSGKTKP